MGAFANRPLACPT